MKTNVSLPLLFCVLMSLLSLFSVADTLIYNNSTFQGGVWGPPDPYIEFIDYGRSPGGRISKFSFDYVTNSSTTGVIWVGFYRYTDRYDPGYSVKMFALTNVPPTGGWVDTYEYIIPEEDRFELSSGDFGYSFKFSRTTTQAAVASGGLGSEDYFWVYDEVYWDDFVLTYFGNSWSGFSMKIYTAPPIEDVTCDISGHKFEDANGNGVWDQNEDGLAGWELYLDTNSDGQYQVSEPNVVTDPNGFYMFENIPSPATYTVAEINQPGWVQTLPGAPDYSYTLVTEPNTLYSGKDFGNQVFSGTIITLPAIEDTYISQANPDTNYGSEIGLACGSDSSGIRRAYVKFDLSSIPPGQRIVSATLQLNGTYFTSPTSLVGVYSATNNWDEMTATWNELDPSLDPADGFLYQTMMSIDWSSWNVTDKADLRYTQDSILSLELRTMNEGVFDHSMGYISKEHFDTANAPRLVIQYEQMFGGGGGTPDDPYQIWTPEQMNTIGLHPERFDRHFKLMTDISMAAYTGSNYNQIGTWSSSLIDRRRFRGVFDGDGHAITDFQAGALFDYINGGRIQRLGLISPVVHDNAALVERLEFGGIAECWIQGGSVNGSSDVGALVGTMQLSEVAGCWSSATVTATGNDVGGLIGSVLGISRIQDCYTTGSVSGQETVGGFIGYSTGGTLTNCYSTASVSGTDEVGGFSGRHQGDEYDYEADVTGCFWDVSVYPISDAGVGLSTGAMQNQSTFTDAGWDFVSETTNGRNNDWSMPSGSGTPVLWYQLPVAPLLPTFAGGTGTEANPYRIATVAQLNSIGHHTRLMDKHFRLMNDLDLSAQPSVMIAGYPYAFSGSFDGNLHAVNNFNVNSTGFSYGVGFIGSAYGANISNLTLNNTSVYSDVGFAISSLVGFSLRSSVQNCHSFNVDVTGLTEVGGMIGNAMWYSTLEGSSVTGSVAGMDTIWSSASHVGGLVGSAYFLCEIDQCAADTSVIGDYSVAGLCAYNAVSSIRNCYSDGRVETLDDQAGGLTASNNGHASYSFSSCEVIAPAEANRVGALMASTRDDVVSCLWDLQINPGMGGIGNGGTHPEVVGLPTAEMHNRAMYLSKGFDFDGETVNGTEDIWTICQATNYPRFPWQVRASDFVCPNGVGLEDFLLISDCWKTYNAGCSAADSNNDNQIDLDDLIPFCQQWLQGR